MQTTTFRGGQEVQTQLFLGRTFHSTSFAGRALVAAQKTKASQVQAMLQRSDLVAVTGWVPHTTRAALTGLRKKGHAVTSEKLDGVRRYRIPLGDALCGAEQ
jgi:hypothetical protein